MGAINIGLPEQNLFISFVKIFLDTYASLSVTIDLSSCLDIAATLVQLIINYLLDHFNLPLVPSHPSSLIQFILSTAVIV